MVQGRTHAKKAGWSEWPLSSLSPFPCIFLFLFGLLPSSLTFLCLLIYFINVLLSPLTFLPISLCSTIHRYLLFHLTKLSSAQLRCTLGLVGETNCHTLGVDGRSLTRSPPVSPLPLTWSPLSSAPLSVLGWSAGAGCHVIVGDVTGWTELIVLIN